MPPLLVGKSLGPLSKENHVVHDTKVDNDAEHCHYADDDDAITALLEGIAAEYRRCQGQLLAATAELARLRVAAGESEDGAPPFGPSRSSTTTTRLKSEDPRNSTTADELCKSKTEGECEWKWLNIVHKYCFPTESGEFQSRSCWAERDIEQQKETNGAEKSKLASQATSQSALSQNSDFFGRDLVEVVFHRMAKGSSGQSTRKTRSHLELTRWYIFLPFSGKRIAWTLTCMFILVGEFTLASINAFFQVGPWWWWWLDGFSVVFWTLDISVSFVTAVYLDGELKTELRLIARKYIKTWFILDLLCQSPAWLNLLLGPWGLWRTRFSRPFFNILRLFPSLRTLRLKQYVHMPELPQDIISPFHTALLLRFLGLIIGVMLWVHISGCIWFSVGCMDGGWVTQEGSLSASAWHNYFTSLFWAASQFKGSNSDSQREATTFESVWSVIAILVSVMAMGLMISGVTNIMLELNEVAKMYTQSHAVITCFKKHHVSTELQHYVRIYVEAQRRGIGSQNRYQEIEDVLSELPTRMKRRVLVEMRGFYAKANPVFVTLKWNCLRCFERLFCDSLYPHFFFPDETVFNFLCHCSQMHFVVEGKMRYEKYSFVRALLAHTYRTSSPPKLRRQTTNQSEKTQQSNDDIQAELKPTRTSLDKDTEISEPVLWTHWIHRGQLVALSQSLLFRLHAADFDRMVTSYAPGIMTTHAARFLEALNAVPDIELTDLFSSITLFTPEEAATPGQDSSRMRAWWRL